MAGETTGLARLESLTGLRFVAALLVFVTHAGETLGSVGLAPFTASARFFDPGATGVTFFFVLSGFVLCWSSRPDDTLANFYRRRFARIYPAYLAAWVAAVLFAVFGAGTLPHPAALGPSLPLLQAWVPSKAVYFAASPVFWTLSVEVFFYLLFPFLLPKLSMLSARRLRLLLWGLVGGTAVVGLVCRGVPWDSTAGWLLTVFPPARLPEFVVGILLALEVKRGTIPRLNLAWCLLAGAVALVVVGMDVAIPRAVVLAPFTAVIAAAAQADLAGRGSGFARPALRTLGRWSYAFYLVHVTVLLVLTELLQRVSVDGPALGVAGGLALGALALMVTITVAAGLSTFVERPWERRLRAWRPGPPVVRVRVARD